MPMFRMMIDIITIIIIIIIIFLNCYCYCYHNRLVDIGYPEAIKQFDYDPSFPVRWEEEKQG